MSETRADPPVVMVLGTTPAGGELALAFERLGVGVALVETLDAAAVIAKMAEVKPRYVVAASPDVPRDPDRRRGDRERRRVSDAARRTAEPGPRGSARVGRR